MGGFKNSYSKLILGGRVKKLIFAGMFLCLFASTAFAGNPIITHIFTSDPAAMVYNGRVYLYTGHDEQSVGGEGFVMNE